MYAPTEKPNDFLSVATTSGGADCEAAGCSADTSFAPGASQGGEVGQSIGLFVPDGFEASSLASLSVFEAANSVLGYNHYAIRIYTEFGGQVRGAFGFSVVTEPLPTNTLDSLLIGGGRAVTQCSSTLFDYLRRERPVARRIAGVGLGTFTLAQAGLLDRRRATTQAEFAHELQSLFPEVLVEGDKLFIEDRSIWTSAGMTAGIDLALALLEGDCGPELVFAVARHLLMHQRRMGSQSQTSDLLDLVPKSDRVQRALAFARENLRLPLTVESLAEAACLSPRQFSRLFHLETGHTPARAVEKLRIDVAQTLIAQGRLPISAIVHETGFGDRERMRRAFHRATGASPMAVRRDTGRSVMA
jgi:transcriptional regulator GlxA family with amidase domain